ncbi:long-chain fatty acid--CoA ligase [Aquibacillus koreensis]|uniref:Long-chain fatty acid--CoA ligase n=1 Tax=Aquibacillus koreensis TaxID=279446 RepID=A0A9X3WMH8_9BACI|nr:long-chain fatty acid--CoA ligase [Aquibacillus koreensis]MCT2536746.1 long-chain fatty acid--CoA ligase [Aquibacillus koreensis]MDC3421498.1 long-chain fatty acid--CoA ligase [Aquibacillus koreensis]
MQNDYPAIKHLVKEFILNHKNQNDSFSEVAKQLFSFQYQNNQAYRKFCRKRRISPNNVHTFTDIPPVPINAFKEATLACSTAEDAEAIFMTSGTTNPEKKGKNIHQDLEVYDLSMETYFKDCMLPDLDRIKLIILFPSKAEMPNSSLAHYLDLAKKQFGTTESEYVVSKDGFDMERLKQLLFVAEKTNEPVFVLGATFSFIQFLDECSEKGIQFQLPTGSRIMETGGAKGKSRSVDTVELKNKLANLFSIPSYACGNMYGMTELSSQIYNQDFKQYFLKQEQQPSFMKSPHWVKTLIVDPETMLEKPEGEKGIIVHYDLANINSVLAIMTEDVGVKEGEGFHLLGRAEGAEAKGCSLAVEQFLSSNREDLT